MHTTRQHPKCGKPWRSNLTGREQAPRRWPRAGGLVPQPLDPGSRLAYKQGRRTPTKERSSEGEHPLPSGPLAPRATNRYLPLVTPPLDSSPPRLQFNDQGLIPAVVQDRLTGEVRMVAWMNAEALDRTLRTRKATFYSRSRRSLWVKGETSGNELHVHSVAADCDGDTLLVLCDPVGPSCHTGRETCFFYELPGDEPALPAVPLLGELERILESRKASTGEKSYTRSLFDGGSPKIGAKIREEAEETAAALAGESDDRVASEAADVLYHLLVGLRYRGIAWRRVLAVLADRLGTSGHAEKAARGQGAVAPSPAPPTGRPFDPE